MTTPREHYQSSEINNKQETKVGDVVIIHDDASRMEWKLIAVERLTVGLDDYIRAPNIHTKTNRPIAHWRSMRMKHN